MPGAAIVTGAAGGIGAAIAARLAADGFAVVIADIDSDGARGRAAEIAGAGHRALAARCDITDWAACEALVEDAVHFGGGLEVLVNNAGITGPHSTFARYPLDDLRQVIEVDLLGTMHCTRAALGPMAAQGRGRIVNIASVAGVHGDPRLAPYAAAKAGVIALTRSLGRELGPSGILVNAVAPGAVAGTGVAGALDPAAAGQARDAAAARTPLGRLAVPDEVAALVSWLCSPAASYSTGAVFDISGGRGAT